MFYALRVKQGKTFKEYPAGAIASIGSVLPDKIPDELEKIELGENFNPNEQVFDEGEIKSIYHKEQNASELIALQKAEGLID